MKHLILIAAIAFSGLASANDGGMAYIDVKGINPANKAGDGTKIEFYGKDAAKFMKLLPTDSSVFYGMIPPHVADLAQENTRAVAMISGGWGLNIYCSGGKVNEGEYVDGKGYVNATFESTQPNCTIELVKGMTHDWLGDAFEMEEKNYRNNMCE